MKKSASRSELLGDVKRPTSVLCSSLLTVLLVSAVFCLVSSFCIMDRNQGFSIQGFVGKEVEISPQNTSFDACETQCQHSGSEPLPRGIISKTSDLKLRTLSGPVHDKKPKPSNLLAIAAGVKQKENVDKMIKKFPIDEFVVMLFHYDGIVDPWRDFEWSDKVIHISAVNQTKWWFAKRFLHPDIVAEYSFIFLWDEDLGLENFDAGRYISIIKEEGLEISQPALDPDHSDIHYPLTGREINSTVHRKSNKTVAGWGKCDENSTSPPCTGWVEMMAPVFSRASWRCAWHMIQNDLVHAWGLDWRFGYCAQGDRTKNMGIVDSEFIIHHGLPTLGGSDDKTNGTEVTTAQSAPRSSEESSGRKAVKKRSYAELDIFEKKWKKAIEEDDCWTDPFRKTEN